ncbi:MAG: vanadium-dependent haloperoxidase [Saprospiraceae bacterium]|nr:vanadium-dependent haloperoxidase [Saprospiraceae bacterium]
MKIIPHTKLHLLLALLGLFMFNACKDFRVEPSRPLVREFDSNVYLRWNDVFLRLDRYAVGYRPGPVPNALGYLGFAAYEAVAPGMPDYNSLANLYPQLAMPQFNENLDYHWPTVINEVYYYMMTRFFFHMEIRYPDLYGQIALTRDLLNAQYANEASPEVIARSKQRGIEVAMAFYEWSRSDDAAHNAFLNPQPPYNAPSGPGYWEPTVPDFVHALFPFWGQVRTFALSENEQLARPPIPYSENPQSLFYTQAMEVYKTVNLINKPNKTPDEEKIAYEQRWLAEFWSDDILGLTFSPPARLVAVANQVAELERINLEEAAELYAKMGMALKDISVGIWQSKYVYSLERPVSYIRRVISKTYPEAANWLPILNNPVDGFYGVTPAFPAYPSGHSGFGGAGAKILSSMFEYNSKHPGTYTLVDKCHLGRVEFRSEPRTLASFNDLSRENAYSRIPLGVHFRMDCDEGIRMGEVAAQRILELPWKK